MRQILVNLGCPRVQEFLFLCVFPSLQLPSEQHRATDCSCVLSPPRPRSLSPKIVSSLWSSQLSAEISELLSCHGLPDACWSSGMSKLSLQQCRLKVHSWLALLQGFLSSKRHWFEGLTFLWTDIFLYLPHHHSHPKPSHHTDKCCLVEEERKSLPPQQSLVGFRFGGDCG